VETVEAACGAPIGEALDIQAKRSGVFMVTPACKNGVIGTTFRKTMVV
jgi:hypothetical protein